MAFLSGVVSSLLNTYLGAFVENVDGTKVSVGLFTGRLTLRNLSLRHDAIATALDLPVRIAAGNIGTIHLDLPLSQLRSKPIVVHIDEVFLLAAPNYTGKRAAYEFVRQQKAKAELLKTLERHFIAAQTAALKNLALATAAESTINSADGGSGTNGISGGSSSPSAYAEPRTFSGVSPTIESLLITAIANLQLRVTRVHVRYEHPVARVPNPLGRGNDWIRCVVLGFTVAEISVLTTNERFEQVAFANTSGPSAVGFKLGAIEGISVYLGHSGAAGTIRLCAINVAST
jgi:vacuolar protein sorting-associated protein 13A/C